MRRHHLVPTALGCIVASLTVCASAATARELTFEDRVAAQKAIEQVYWSHRIWPKENPQPKPPLSAVMSDDAIRAKVEAYVKEPRTLSGAQLQAEMNRMATSSQDPQLLRELFAALGNDPFLIAETLVRPNVARRLAPSTEQVERWESDFAAPAFPYSLPEITSSGGCTADTWQKIPGNLVDARIGHIAIWTGSEMIVWGSDAGSNSGGRYNPATDTWTVTSTGPNAPAKRQYAVGVWTGVEMIVWGGRVPNAGYLNSGGRYNPITDTWTATSTGANVPQGRYQHTAVWNGSEMIVWGGTTTSLLNTGGRYNPSTDTWTATSTGPNVPAARYRHSAVWTGSEMIVWGGYDYVTYLNTGARYNPSADTWTPTSTGANVPVGRNVHTAVWTGSQMVIWGGNNGTALNSGGRYTPSTDTWTPTSIGAGVPTARYGHSAVWTGSEMIVWGGYDVNYVNTGGRYAPSTDTWMPTPTSAGVPGSRSLHSSVWTGSEMIVWGGVTDSESFNSGGRFSPSSNSWTPTAIPGSAPSPRSSAAAIWTGVEMIVWGGLSSTGVLKSGGRYDPATDTWTPTSLGTNVPSARGTALFAWTGTELVVWGGKGLTAGEYPLSGGRYNPASDTWLPTSMVGVPHGRTSSVAVWGGSEMFFSGGWYYDAAQSRTFYLGDGGRYNPSTDSWTAIPSSAMAEREAHTAVWAGSALVNCEGELVGNFPTGCSKYSPGAGWSSLGGGPQGRTGHVSFWTGSEVIVWGGNLGAPGLTNTGGRLNPATGQWVATSTGANVPSGSSRLGVWTGQDMIVWYPGFNDNARYSPATDSWQRISTDANTPTEAGSVVFSGREMLAWGGSTSAGGRYCACPSARYGYRDADGDGHGDPLVTVLSSCDGTLPAGYSADGTDCNDSDPNNWSSCATCADGDGDGYLAGCDRYVGIPGPDCNDNNASVHPGAPEINDGIDNQCPGDAGYGTIDELSETTGFFTAGDKALLSWTPQSGATMYETMRSSGAGFQSSCASVTSSDPFVAIPEIPGPQQAYFFLVHPVAPHVGSWGVASSGIERDGACLIP